MVSISVKLEKSKRKTYFQELRVRAALSSRLRTFKALHLGNVLTGLATRKKAETWNRINRSGRAKLHALRRLSRI
jgi:hypothetical protein